MFPRRTVRVSTPSPSQSAAIGSHPASGGPPQSFFPNPFLKPETSRGWEAGANFLAGPALTARIIADVTPLDEQFGAARKKSVPDALWPVLFGPLGPDGAGAASKPLPCYAILDAGRVPGLPDLLAASGLALGLLAV